MHESVMAFVARSLTSADVVGKRVLEVGSYDVNGSVRPLVESLAPAQYIGTDMREGPGVDLVLDACSLVEHFGEAAFDVVLCAEVLEHCEDWRTVVRQLKSVLVPGGLLLLTTRSKGFPLHEYPGDFWRFEKADMHQIFSEMEMRHVETDTQAPGVFVSARAGWASTAGGRTLTCISVYSMLPPPMVTLAILAKQKAAVLPLYLHCIEHLDYPKDRIHLYVRTNDNTDDTAEILRAWLAQHGSRYASVLFDDTSVDPLISTVGVHEWGARRFSVLGEIRQESLKYAVENKSKFYFVVDCDNYLKPQTLSRLVGLDLPLVAPLLRHSDPARLYSNFHQEVDDNGYLRDCPEYYTTLNPIHPGVEPVACVHCTYLIRCDVADHLHYRDASARHEYVIFSESARNAGVQQYLDNREVYGYLDMDEDPAPAAARLGVALPAHDNPSMTDARGWAVVILAKTGSVHHEAFREVAEALVGALEDLGHDALLVVGPPLTNRRCILLGVAAWGEDLPQDAVIYNMEQVGSPWFTPLLIETYRRHVVWDYSASNAERFPEVGLPAPVVVPFGYHPRLERIQRLPEAERDIDVLHVGSLNERRDAVLKELEGLGLKVQRLFGVYGAERDAYYARAKLVINVHFYESAIFESARVGYCAANGIPVVSEESAGDEGLNLAWTVPYAALPHTVEKLLSAPASLLLLGEQLQHVFRGTPLHTALAEALRGLDRITAVTAPAPATPLALCMIVKNESRVIRRCLTSIKPFITHWCIVDTGSTDGTQDIVREFMRDLPGELLEHPWTREDENRTRALDAARKLAPYVIWIDADEVFAPRDGFVMPLLTADWYNLKVRNGEILFDRSQIVKSCFPWRWIGVVHPYLDGPGAQSFATLQDAITLPSPDGASWSDPDKYRKHAALLKAELKKDPTNTRNQYYLAQSYRDANEPEKALEHFLRRAKMRAGDEETWVALFEAAKLKQQLKRPSEEIVSGYLTAWRARPSRAEPLDQLANFFIWTKEWEPALLFARQAAATPLPQEDFLFIDLNVYRWKALDNLAVAAGSLGRKEEAIAALRKLLPVLPPSERPRVRANAVATGIDIERIEETLRLDAETT